MSECFYFGTLKSRLSWHKDISSIFHILCRFVYFTATFCLEKVTVLNSCLSRPLDTTGQLSSVQTDALYFCLELRVMEDIKEEEKHRDGGGKLLYTVFVD